MDITMEKPAFTQNNSRLHAFLGIIPWKGMPFRSIIHGKSNFVHEYLSEIREKISNYYLTFIRGLLGIVMKKKNETKKSHATVPLKKEIGGYKKCYLLRFLYFYELLGKPSAVVCIYCRCSVGMHQRVMGGGGGSEGRR